jgi:hypothetical protein
VDLSEKGIGIRFAADGVNQTAWDEFVRRNAPTRPAGRRILPTGAPPSQSAVGRGASAPPFYDPAERVPARRAAPVVLGNGEAPTPIFGKTPGDGSR